MPVKSVYPQGFDGGVSIRGLPVLNTYGGNVFWVSSEAGASDQNKGTERRPFATWDYAIGKCTANNGDIIMIKAGHTETISAAGGIAMDVAGVTVICLGEGADRPTFTFSATASTITMSAASCAILGFPIFTPSIDSVVSPLVVSAADCSADIEVKDASDAIECVRAVLTTASADRLELNLRYLGRTGGNACVNAVRLVGGDGVRVNLDAYGKFSTAVVEFLTTACTDVVVKGYAYNSGTTDGSKLVVDTVTGSTWWASIEDGAAGASFSGGSGGALAADDVGAVSSLIGTANLTTTDSLHGKIGTDTELADRSLFDLLVSAGPASFPSAAAAANDVSMAAVLRYASENQLPRIVSFTQADLTAATAWTTGNSPVSLFTVTGDVLVQLFARITTQITSTLNNGTLEVGIVGNTAGLLVQDTADGTAFDAGDVWTLISAADTGLGQLADEWAFIGNGADIAVTIATNSVTAGGIIVYCRYIPISSGASVVSA